jgi:hypothetical protein
MALEGGAGTVPRTILKSEYPDKVGKQYQIRGALAAQTPGTTEAPALGVAIIQMTKDFAFTSSINDRIFRII